MAARHNLPPQLTSFVDREQEQIVVRRLLGATRLLTLSGSGGVGNTRLALQVAAAVLGDYPDGAWFVDLAAVADQSLVLQAVASSVAVRELPGRPLIEALPQALVAKQLLLLLDNCEHVVSTCARLTYTLLQACPHLTVLTTSREPLNIAGETVWRVPSLTLPGFGESSSLEQLRKSEAVRLFEERAVSSLPDLGLTDHNCPAVAKICRRLDGMPLAIELAAARVKLLSVDQIATRLDERFRLLTGGRRSAPTRQQTIRATIDWSYELLTESERRLFERLAIFAGGWTLEAAEALGSGGPIERCDVLDLLGRLVDKSLIVVDGDGRTNRYRFLETIREYALERLSEGTEIQTLRRAHAALHAALAKAAELQLSGPSQVEWLDRLDMEYDNFRAAIRWSLDQGDVPTVLRCAAALARFGWIRGRLREQRQWWGEALERCGGKAHQYGQQRRSWQGRSRTSRETTSEPFRCWTKA
jgi:predicted ATPase